MHANNEGHPTPHLCPQDSNLSDEFVQTGLSLLHCSWVELLCLCEISLQSAFSWALSFGQSPLQLQYVLI